MLEWLKGKVKQGIEAGQKVIIANSLASHFASLEDPKSGIPGIASRLANFVVSGEDHNSVADLVPTCSARFANVDFALLVRCFKSRLECCS